MYKTRKLTYETLADAEHVRDRIVAIALVCTAFDHTGPYSADYGRGVAKAERVVRWTVRGTVRGTGPVVGGFKALPPTARWLP